MGSCQRQSLGDIARSTSLAAVRELGKKRGTLSKRGNEIPDNGTGAGPLRVIRGNPAEVAGTSVFGDRADEGATPLGLDVLRPHPIGRYRTPSSMNSMPSVSRDSEDSDLTCMRAHEWAAGRLFNNSVSSIVARKTFRFQWVVGNDPRIDSYRVTRPRLPP